MSEPTARVSWASTINYSLPAAALAYMASLAAMYLLKFASDVLLIAPALFSTFFVLSRVVDAISDPAAGYASDRTRLALGRRRPWVLAAAIPMCACFWAVWSPPSFLPKLGGPELASAWVGVALVLYYLAHTAAAVPHLALGAELTADHHDRTRVFGVRAVAEFVGMGAAAGSMAWLQTSDDPRAAARMIATLFSFATLLLLIPSTLRMAERPEFQARTASSPLRALRDVAGNPHARILLGVLIIDTLSLNMMGVLFPFIAAYALPEGTAPSSTFIGATIAIAIGSFPVWPVLARRYGKRNAWLMALAIRILGFAIMLFGWDRPWLQAMTVVLVATSMSCTFVLPPSIKADVIDYDELLSGERKEGSYFACWNFAQKLAAAGAVAIAGGALELIGYEANALQTATARTAMQWLFTGAPLLMHLVAFWLLCQLRLDTAEHARIRTELDRRNGLRHGAWAPATPPWVTKEQ